MKITEKEVKMDESQIEKVVKWLELKTDNAKAEMMLTYLKQPRQTGDKSSFIQKNLQPSILRSIIY
jgi:hypothetical protein